MGQDNAPLGSDDSLPDGMDMPTRLALSGAAGASNDPIGSFFTTDTHFRALFEALDDGFCVIEKVQGSENHRLDFTYVEANRAFVAQAGVNPVHGIVGKTIRQLFPDLTEDWYTTLDEALTASAPVRFERELVPGKHWLEVCASPVATHKKTRLAVIFKDITHRVLAQHTLH